MKSADRIDRVVTVGIRALPRMCSAVLARCIDQKQNPCAALEQCKGARIEAEKKLREAELIAQSVALIAEDGGANSRDALRANVDRAIKIAANAYKILRNYLPEVLP